MKAPGWEQYLRERFPAYLLPSSAAHELDIEAARRFMDAFIPSGTGLALLRAASLFAPRRADLQEMVGLFSDLVRRLPSETVAERKVWNGGFQGRLLVPETAQLHLQGQRTSFVTRTRHRSFDLPENVVVRSVAARVLSELTALREADVVVVGESEGTLRRMLAASALRHVTSRPVTPRDQAAAQLARHPAYHKAAEWCSLLEMALDDDDPNRIAALLAAGALLPLTESTRFELAVALRLAESLFVQLDATQPSRWHIQRNLIIHGRRDIISFQRDDGFAVRLFYNQSELSSGPADQGANHYLSNRGRLRPDITLTVDKGSHRLGAVIIECKHSTSRDYALAGLHEAHLYRWEYAPFLTLWPKSILVISAPDVITGPIRPIDDVLACSWPQWPAVEITSGLAAEVLARGAVADGLPAHAITR